MLYYKTFKFCPVCGTKYSAEDFIEDDLLFVCNNCDYRFYQNMDPAAAVIIPKLDEPKYILFTTRNMNPGKGKIDIPGGFLRYGEHPKEGARREILEEMNVQVDIREHISTQIVTYEYNKVQYKHVTQYYLAAPIQKLPKIKDRDENQDVQFIDVTEVIATPERLAFEPDALALKDYQDKILREYC